MSGILFLIANTVLQAVLLLNSFELRCKLCEVLEGGPVVIRVDFLYKGKQPIQTEAFFFGGFLNESRISVSAVEHWTTRTPKPTIAELIGHIGYQPTVSEATLKPNTSLVAYLYLHHKYDVIPPGPFEVTISFQIREPSEDSSAFKPFRRNSGKPKPSPFTISLKYKVEGVIPAATPKHINDMAIRLNSSTGYR